MPNLTKPKKSNRSLIETLVFVAAMIVIFIMDTSTLVRLLAGFGVFLVYIFYKRSLFVFARAVKFMQKGDPKAWTMFKKAVKTGLDPEKKNMVATAFIQRADDFEYGIQLLEEIIAKEKGNSAEKTAIVTVSMGYWRQGKLDQAIDLLWKLYEEGYKDANLVVNLGAYLLEKGDIDRARMISEFGMTLGPEASGLVDNRLWRAILSSEWEEARKLADELVNDRIAKFPEAYLHAAQVHVHYGEISKALDCLGWSLGKTFTKTCIVKKDYIEKLILGLDNPETSDAFAKAMDENPLNVASCKDFDGLENACEFTGPKHELAPQVEDRKPGSRYVPASADDTPDYDVEDEDFPDTSVDDEDDEMPDTSLDDEDYEDEEDEEMPNTDLDDEDDEDPDDEKEHDRV